MEGRKKKKKKVRVHPQSITTQQVNGQVLSSLCFLHNFPVCVFDCPVCRCVSLIVERRKRVVNCLLIVCYAEGTDESLAFLYWLTKANRRCRFSSVRIGFLRIVSLPWWVRPFFYGVLSREKTVVVWHTCCQVDLKKEEEIWRLTNRVCTVPKLKRSEGGGEMGDDGRRCKPFSPPTPGFLL